MQSWSQKPGLVIGVVYPKSVQSSHNLVKSMERGEGLKVENGLTRRFCQQVSSLRGQHARVKRAKDNWITQLFTENEHISMESEWILLVCAECRHSLVVGLGQQCWDKKGRGVGGDFQGLDEQEVFVSSSVNQAQKLTSQQLYQGVWTTGETRCANYIFRQAAFSSALLRIYKFLSPFFHYVCHGLPLVS